MSQHTFCSHCGTKFETEEWPRPCGACRKVTFRNPLPVAVAVVPIVDPQLGQDSILVVRRTIEPAAGELALPGGYMEVGETWQEAVVRELEEETGVVFRANQVTLIGVQSPPSNAVLIFGMLPSLPELPPLRANHEVSELVLANRGTQLAFSTHQEILRKWFSI